MSDSVSRCAILVTLTALGCSLRAGSIGELPADESGGEDAGESGGTSDTERHRVHYQRPGAIDILIVVDNSGSMGDRQRVLTESLPPLVDVLEDPEIGADYRIGFTTTDNGNPWCTGSSPEGGMLRASSCRERLSEFIFEGTTPAIDKRAEACTDACAHESIEIQPTTTERDSEPKARPWLEHIAGQTNLPDGITPSEAARCFAPQGINGCGFEQPLESMYKSLSRMMDPAESAHGFIRDGAYLAIVIVTDEADCSYRSEAQAMFLPEPEGNQVFWSDVEAQFPTSAVCWNAGVACTGGPGTYDECHVQNYDIDGNTSTDEAAVLHPLSRYWGVVQSVENAKKLLDPNSEVHVVVVAGVPEGYSDGSAEITYADAEDPQFQDDFGIGPGCRAVDPMGQVIGEAVPPVRLREFAEAFAPNGRNLISVCQSDYAEAFQDVLPLPGDAESPPCMPVCVADTDVSTPGLQPDCSVEEEYPSEGGRVSQTVPPCDVAGNGWSFPNEATACHLLLTDPSGATASTIDDMSGSCVDSGFNLEVEVMRVGSTLAGTAVYATCKVADPQTGC